MMSPGSSFATRIQRDFDLDAARAALGHAGPAVSLGYVERDTRRAAEVAQRVGEGLAGERVEGRRYGGNGDASGPGVQLEKLRFAVGWLAVSAQNCRLAVGSCLM